MNKPMQISVEFRLAMLIESDGIVQIRNRFVREDGPEEIDQVAGRFNVDLKVRVGKAEDVVSV